MSGDFGDREGPSPSEMGQGRGKTNENVNHALRGIQERRERVNRFTGADLIRAEQEDVAHEIEFAGIMASADENAGLEIDRLQARSKELTRVNRMLATINADQTSELTDEQLEEVLAHFENRRRILDHEPNKNATENRRIYQAIIDDIYHQLEGDRRRQPETAVVLKVLRENEEAPRTDLPDGIRLVDAEGHDLKADAKATVKNYAGINLSDIDLDMILEALANDRELELPPEIPIDQLAIYSRIISALTVTHEGLEKVIQLQKGEPVDFDFYDLLNVLGYFRNQRRTWMETYAESDHTDDEALGNGEVYAEVIDRINEVVPHTPETQLTEIPTYTPSPERLRELLNPFVAKAAAGKLDIADARTFYEALQRDVSDSMIQAQSDSPEWEKQKTIRSKIREYVHKHKTEIEVTDPPTFLMVSVKNGEPDIIPYKPEPGSSLQADLLAHDGTFIFDPNPARPDLQYTDDLVAFDKWVLYADAAAEGMKELTSGKMFQRPTITTTQQLGMTLLFGLFRKGVQSGSINTTEHIATVNALGEIILQKATSAKVKDVPIPEIF